MICSSITHELLITKRSEVKNKWPLSPHPELQEWTHTVSLVKVTMMPIIKSFMCNYIIGFESLQSLQWHKSFKQIYPLSLTQYFSLSCKLTLILHSLSIVHVHWPGINSAQEFPLFFHFLCLCECGCERDAMTKAWHTCKCVSETQCSHTVAVLEFLTFQHKD